MQETKGLLDRIRNHDKLSMMVNENCKVDLPSDVLEKLRGPHRLAHYCFIFLDQGSEVYKVDYKDVPITGGQMVFGLPNQIFLNPSHYMHTLNYKVAFDENVLTLLPNSLPFLLNPYNANVITFDHNAKERVKSLFSHLFQFLHSPERSNNTDLILAYFNTLLSEFNSAYFEQNNQDSSPKPKLSKYIAFKLAVETHLTEQHDVNSIAKSLSTNTSTLYGVVKEFSGLSPKEWMTNRLILEAQRKLQSSPISTKELAYQLGFNDPAYFSRLFKKSTGKSISAFLAKHHD